VTGREGGSVRQTDRGRRVVGVNIVMTMRITLLLLLLLIIITILLLVVVVLFITIIIIVIISNSCINDINIY
jgi:hypothetical protein